MAQFTPYQSRAMDFIKVDALQKDQQRQTRLDELALRKQGLDEQKAAGEQNALIASTLGSVLGMAANAPNGPSPEVFASGLEAMETQGLRLDQKYIDFINRNVKPALQSGDADALRFIGGALGGDVSMPEAEGFSNIGTYQGPQGQGVYGVRGDRFEMIPGGEGLTPVRPPSTTVSVDTGGPAPNVDAEATKALGRARGDRAGERLAAADQAFQMNMQLATISEALAGGAETGAGEETLLGLRSLASSFMPGFYSEQDLAQMGQQELIRAVGNQMALRLRNPDSGLGLPGAASNRDIQLLQSLVPGLALTEEGNQQLIGVLRAINDFKIALADEQERIIDENDGSVPRNLESQLRKFSQGYELFEVGDRISLYLAAGRQVEFGDDGAYLLKEGGDPSNANDWERIGG